MLALPLLILRPAQSGGEQSERSPCAEGEPARRIGSRRLQVSVGNCSTPRTGVCVIVAQAGAEPRPGLPLRLRVVRVCLNRPAITLGKPFGLTTPGGQPVSLLGEPAAIARCESLQYVGAAITLTVDVSAASANTRRANPAGISHCWACRESRLIVATDLPPRATISARHPVSTRESVC